MVSASCSAGRSVAPRLAGHTLGFASEPGLKAAASGLGALATFDSAALVRLFGWEPVAGQEALAKPTGWAALAIADLAGSVAPDVAAGADSSPFAGALPAVGLACVGAASGEAAYPEYADGASGGAQCPGHAGAAPAGEAIHPENADEASGAGAAYLEHASGGGASDLAPAGEESGAEAAYLEHASGGGASYLAPAGEASGAGAAYLEHADGASGGPAASAVTLAASDWNAAGRAMQSHQGVRAGGAKRVAKPLAASLGPVA